MKTILQEFDPKKLSFTEKLLLPGSVRNLSLLEHIEKVIDMSSKKGIIRSLFRKAKHHLNYITHRLSVSPMQAVLFCHFLNKSDNHSIGIDDIAESIKSNNIKMLGLMNDIDALVTKGLICRNRHSETSYHIPQDVINTIRKGTAVPNEKYCNITIDEMFGFLEELFEKISEHEIDYDELHTELKSLIDENMHLLFCQKIMSYNLDGDNTILLLCFCHLYINNNDDNIGIHDFNFLYDKKSKERQIARRFSEGDHVLFNYKFIENTNSDGFVTREAFRLTDNAKSELFSELNLLEHQIKRKKGMILYDSISIKKMYYNEKEQEKIDKLKNLLLDENLKKVQDRLGENGMRKGFACLFSGSPGTGKTETVYQIAKETNRNIMAVDISAIKGMYVGETEKKIMEVFSNYKAAVNASERIPILLFNEADAIIGKRMEFGNNSHAVDRMENTMQNIILQELENLTGILIATTNLTQNMDKAFERRFLYKIEFEKPNITSRRAIWRSMLPNLSEADSYELASKYDFSGGQIENIARKRMVENVIAGIEPAIDVLHSYCKDELFVRDDSVKQIGFTV
jgi:hypothetical protein